jgi:hypothetical protein
MKRIAVLLLVLGLFIVGCTQNSTQVTNASTGSQPQNPTQGTQVSTSPQEACNDGTCNGKIGFPVMLSNGLNISVSYLNSAKNCSDLEDAFGYYYQINTENSGTTSVDMSSISLVLIDSQNQQFEGVSYSSPCVERYPFSSSYPISDASTLYPGASYNGWIFFETKKAIEAKKIIIENGKNTIIFTGLPIDAKECSDGTEYDKCSNQKPKFCQAGQLIEKATLCGCGIGYDIQGDSCIAHIEYCNDNTAVGNCSITKPKLCDTGKVLVDAAQKCGCTNGYDVQNSTCVLHVDKCGDGTLFSQCSPIKPKYCNNGVLIDNPTTCGCPDGTAQSGNTCAVPKVVEISNGSYTANGLNFDVKLDESGTKISYKDLSGDTTYLAAQNGKKLLKFLVTVTSLDGDKGFYSSSFSLMDGDGNTYDSVCPINPLTYNCKNQDGIESMYSPISGEKKTGIVIFSIPDGISKVSLVYKFSTYDIPQAIKFNFNTN